MLQEELSDDESTVYAEPLSQPHFDDEATLLSARPVVPLSKSPYRRRTGRWLPFTGAIVLSLFAGAFGASFLYSERSNPQASPQVTADREQSTVAIEPVTPATEPESSAIQTAAGQDADGGNTFTEEFADTEQPEAVRPAPAPRHRKETPAARNVTKRSGFVSPPVVSNPPLRESREERRPRRVNGGITESQKQALKEDSAADLFRIREIFEGPRRRRLRSRSSEPF